MGLVGRIVAVVVGIVALVEGIVVVAEGIVVVAEGMAMLAWDTAEPEGTAPLAEVLLHAIAHLDHLNWHIIISHI